MNGASQPKSKNRNGTISSRLATVETRVESLHHSVESLTTAVDSLGQRIGQSGKMSWPLMVASIGVLASWTAVVGYVGRMAIEPVQVRLSNLQEQVKQHQADGHPHTEIGQMNAMKSRNNERFAEVETQIRSVRELRQSERAYTRELVDLKTRLAIYEARYGALKDRPRE